MLDTAASLFDSFLCIWFITSFIRPSKRKFAVALPAVAVYFALSLVCDKYLSGFNVLASFILLVPAAVYAFMICERHFIKAIIACSIYKVVVIVASSLLFTVISSLIDDFGALLVGSDATVRVIYIVLHKIVAVTVFSAIVALFGRSGINDILTGVIVFGTSAVTVVGLGAAMVIIAQSDAGSSGVSSVLLVCSFLLINAGIYTFVNHIKKLEKQKYELQIMKDRYEYRHEQYQDAVNVWSRIKKIRHDIKNHLLIVREKLVSKEYDDCVRYVDSLIPGIEKIGDVRHTGSDIIDYLLNTKILTLENAEVSITGVVSDLSDIPESDQVSIFGNIIDNMAEAVAPLGEKRIELRFAKVEENRIMIFRNSVASPVLVGGELKSAKSDAESHGLGHIIVEETVAKLGGMIEYSESDGMFALQLILPVGKS